MFTKKISIILPVYNSEKTLSRVINSIINQTYKNYELIIINDGSTDNSDQICKKYSEKYSQIKYIKINNTGVSSARNLGMKSATGNYIMFVDSDDEYYKDTLETVEKYMDNENELIIFGYDRIHTNKNKTKLMNTNVTYLKNGKDKHIFIEKMEGKYLFNQIWNKVYKHEILKKYNIFFDENINSGEDYRFNLKYIEIIDNAIYIDKILYKYYSSEEGLSLKSRPDKIYIKLENLKKQRELYDKFGYPTDYIEKNYVYTCLSGITAIIDTENPREIKKNLERYILNKEIEKNLKNIQKKVGDLKIKISISILLVKNITILKLIANILIILRKIYRKIKLG